MLIGKIIGILLCAAGLMVFISDLWEDKRCTADAAAVILDVIAEVRRRRRRSGSGYRTYYYPVIEFSTPEKTIRAKPRIKGYHPDTFVKGKQLDILYNPENPYDLKRPGNTVWEGVIGMGIFFLLGAIFFYVSAGGLTRIPEPEKYKGRYSHEDGTCYDPNRQIF